MDTVAEQILSREKKGGDGREKGEERASENMRE
jgi:hypothetical protein